jgi:pimeloyl-ACP methyl ester carboxylesterase
LKYDGQMERRHFNVTTLNAELSGVLLSSNKTPDRNTSCRRLLLIHGAGVAGELTWSFVANYLQNWDEILIPDLPSMGGSSFQPRINVGDYFNRGVGFELYIDSLHELLHCFKWDDFSLGGYSFGGLLALHLSEQFSLRSLALIEPAALLSVRVGDLIDRGRLYHDMGNKILSSPYSESEFLQFLNTVSPDRSSDEKMDALAIKRLMAKPLGLAHGVLAVGEALQAHAADYAVWAPIIPGCSFVGGLSGQSMKERHRLLASKSLEWQFHEIPESDHGLIYTRPRQIARLMDASLHLGWE